MLLEEVVASYDRHNQTKSMLGLNVSTLPAKFKCSYDESHVLLEHYYNVAVVLYRDA